MQGFLLSTVGPLGPNWPHREFPGSWHLRVLRHFGASWIQLPVFSASPPHCSLCAGHQDHRLVPPSQCRLPLPPYSEPGLHLREKAESKGRRGSPNRHLGETQPEKAASAKALRQGPRGQQPGCRGSRKRGPRSQSLAPCRPREDWLLHVTNVETLAQLWMTQAEFHLGRLLGAELGRGGVPGEGDTQALIPGQSAPRAAYLLV